MKYWDVIYWYTTRLNRKEAWAKNGSARRFAQSAEDAARIRITEQITAANRHDPFEILHIEDVTDLCETGNESTSLSNLRQLEAYLHKQQKKMGMWVEADSEKSEWYRDPLGQSVDNIVEIGKRLMNDRRYGSLRPDKYTMRTEQQECHDKVVEWFVHFKGKKFLISAKMRFGKTFTTYKILKTLREKLGKDDFKVLVLTYKPAVNEGWDENLESHVDFEGWNYQSAGDDFDSANPIQLDSGPQILFSSFQDILDIDKEKWKIAKDYKYDVLVLDEEHYGTRTVLAQDIMSRLQFDYKLHLSGTPLKAIESGEFLSEEIYMFSYADEQALKLAEQQAGWATETYRWLPTMNFHTFSVSDAAKSALSLYTEDEGFTMRKMFASDNGKTFNDQSAVKLFLDQIWGNGVHKSNSALRTYAADHMFWIMPPDVKAVNAMCLLLNQYQDQYVIINVAGDNEDDIARVKSTIKQNERTITVSAGRFNTGVTVPEWDVVMMLDDGKSPETYYQTVFRCQSSDKARRKENCYVMDFNPQRCLQMAYEFAEITSRPKGQNVTVALREFLDFAPIMDHRDNKLVKIQTDDVLKMMSDTGSYAERFGSNEMLNWDLLDSVKLYFSNVKVDKLAKKSQQIADNDIEGGINFNQIGTNAAINAKDPAMLERKALREKITTVMRRLPTYLLVEEPVESTNDIFNLDHTQLFYDSVGIGLSDFQDLCAQGFIRVPRLDRCIISYNHDMSTEMPFLKVIDKISLLYSVGSQNHTRWALAKQVIDSMPVDWRDPSLKICDPSCGRGTFLLAAAAKLLESGHDKARVAKMLYGSDTDMVQCKIADKALTLALGQGVTLYCEDSLRRNWNMKFDVIVGNPPFEESHKNGQRKDQASNLWSRFWPQAFRLTHDNGKIALVTPTSWLSPSADVKRKEDKINRHTRLWDMFDDYTSVANITDVAQHFAGVGSSFGYVIVDKSGTAGLSFTDGSPTELGFLPKSGIDEVKKYLHKHDNLGNNFKINQSNTPDIRVSIPMTRALKSADMIEILQGTSNPTKGNPNPGLYIYVHVNNLEEATRVRDNVVAAIEVLRVHCRWGGFLNIKTTKMIRY